ncbi:MAG TPA: ribosome maturation factor RimM [Beijerinckiaceae bacterium]|nr:ribosome maturation factor RimM [Beijerinckiaceae bacterium]
MVRRKRPLSDTPRAAPAAPETRAPEGPMVQMGVFGAAVGLRGEIRVKSWTGDPEAIGDYGPLFAADGRRFDVEVLRLQKDMAIARVKGVSDRTAAEKLTNVELFVPRAALGEVADEDEFFHADLVGLRAETADGTLIGTVTAILNFGAGDVVEVRPPRGPSRAFPFTKAVVPVVDIPGGRIVVVPPTEVEGDEGRGPV